MDRKCRHRCGDVGIRTSTVDPDSSDQRWKGVILWTLMYDLRLKDKDGLQGRKEKGESWSVSGMGQGLGGLSPPRKDRTRLEDMAVGSNHVISKDDDRILKLTYDLALGKIPQE
jgi:hypothetical protein